MPKKRIYKLSLTICDHQGNPILDDNNVPIPPKNLEIKFDKHGNIRKMIDGNGDDLVEDSGFVEMPGDNVIEAIADRNPSWVRINGRWYYI